MKTWRERIVEARARGMFTQADHSDALKWISCAVGEQRRLLGAKVIVYRVGDGVTGWDVKDCGRLGPKDDDLTDWGGSFFHAVRNDRFDYAERLLDKIEDRALQLKRAKNSGTSKEGQQ